MEADPFSPFNDPSGEKYHFYRGKDYEEEEKSILDCYKHYNGTQGNSIDDPSVPYSTAAKSTPDVEDINADNTLSETESYYQYKVELRPDKMQVGMNNIVDSRTVMVNLVNGKKESVTWYQFKIPINNYQKAVGSIDGFSSIRFMRMFMTNFSQTTFLRFATLDLVRNEWRAYENSLLSAGSETGNGTIDVSSVNIEENGDMTPVNYVLPPGVSRTTDASQSQVIAENEASMTLKVKNLDPNDSRAAYKTVSLDLRRFKRLQMFSHLEELVDGSSLNKGDLSIFLRLGTDYRSNYYEYEIPLTVTPAGSYSNNSTDDRTTVWPSDNMFNFPLALLKNVKLDRNKAQQAGENGVSYTTAYYEYDPDKPNNKVTVMGNPTLGGVKVMMIGIRNKSTTQKSGTVWVDEMRLNDFDEKGGWAAQGGLNISLADLGTVTLTGHKETDGFGALDESMLERRGNTYENYTISTNLDLGKFVSKKLKLSAPFYYNYSKETVKEKYNVYDSDVTLKETLSTLKTKHEKDSIRSVNQTQAITKGLAINNLKFNIRSKNPMPYDPANFTISYSSNETRAINPTTEYDSQQNMKFSLSYSYSPATKSWSPFKKSKSKSGLIKSLKNFSFNYLPSNIAFNSYMQRAYQETKLRDIGGVSSDSISTDLLTWSQEFYWTRDSYLTWDFTKNLKLDFQSTTKAEIEEPYTQVNKKANRAAYEMWKDSVWHSILHWGKPLTYNQSLKLTYNVPLSYFPALNWMTAAASYDANYTWTRASVVKNDTATLNLGNVISNTKALTINTKFNLISLYNKSASSKRRTSDLNSH